jgi:ankyrin repeat protein
MTNILRLGSTDKTAKLHPSGGEMNVTAWGKLFCLGLAAFGFSQDTTLHMAAARGDDLMVTAFVENGANVDETMVRGYTPLMVAAKYGHVKVMAALLRARADINRGDAGGNTALMIAVTARKPQAVKFLLDNNADTKIKNRDGLDALELANLIKDDAIIRLLKSGT